MKKFISILLFVLSLQSFACNRDTTWRPFGIVRGDNLTGVPILIIMAGESNAGGLADNSYATPTELGVRRLKILNNTTLASFDRLDIGTNNLVGHVGILGCYPGLAVHGWELEVANRYDAGDFGNRPVYIVKAGQGGSHVSEWADESTFSSCAETIEPYDTYIARVQAAISLITSIRGVAPQVVMFWTIGINDAGIGTSTSTYKTAVESILNSMRADLGIGDFPIFQTQFQSTGSGSVYNTKITEIASDLPAVWAINTTGFETSQVLIDGSGNHWGYTGAKALADAMVDLLLSIF